MIYNMLRPEHKIGAHFINNKGDETSKSPYFGNDDVREKVWQHSVEVTGLEETSKRSLDRPDSISVLND